MENESIEQAALDLEESKAALDEKWLTFRLEKQLYGVSIASVEQIVSIQPVTAVPEYPDYAKGVINLRGAIIPVVDLRARLGKPEAQYTDHTCIIINRVNREQLGFIVDEVDAVIDIPKEAISLPPSMGDDGVNRYLTGLARVTGDDAKEKIVLCLEASMVLAENEVQALESTHRIKTDKQGEESP